MKDSVNFDSYSISLLDTSFVRLLFITDVLRVAVSVNKNTINYYAIHSDITRNTS